MLLSRFGLSLLLVGLLTQQAVGQKPLATGDSVRLSAEQYGLEEQVAVVYSVGAGNLEIMVNGDDTAVAIPLVAISQLERRVENRRTKLGAYIGGALGASLGAIIGDYKETRTCLSDNWFFCTSQRTETEGLGALLLGATLGAGLGALVGSRFRYGSWAEIDVPCVTPTGSGAAGAGVRLGATIWF